MSSSTAPKLDIDRSRKQLDSLGLVHDAANDKEASSVTIILSTNGCKLKSKVSSVWCADSRASVHLWLQLRCSTARAPVKKA